MQHVRVRGVAVAGVGPSGTTANFSEFLVEGAPGLWKLGSSSTISWPAASRGENGNGGVAQIIKTTPGAGSYPITYQSRVLVYKTQPSANTAKMRKAYIGYLLGDGQKLLPQLNYAPLPASIDPKATAQLPMIGSSS
jgi:ABC-type phosphate transport system substrate-binding protein